MKKRVDKSFIILLSSIAIVLIACIVLLFLACSNQAGSVSKNDTEMQATEKPANDTATQQANTQSQTNSQKLAELEAQLNIHKDIRASFNHGPKTKEYQKYIVLHDTEGEGTAQNVIDYWDSNGNLIAAHFVVNRDGSIWQCVELDNIGHHAGYGNTGHNALYGITEDGRDDMKGSKPLGSSLADYGMNAWSVGIEMVHTSGGGAYNEAQLNALDLLIKYIDTYYGFESTIIDHKAWREGNSDTSPEFAQYLANYKDHRTHN
ncbi:MAG: N-acetylmuramoyl-L-alanine amidase [bacterium]|nr:N-acetylmuramoyl-L-alanine amidase [bacterium]